MSILNLQLPTFSEIREEQKEQAAAEERRHKKRLRRSYEAARRNRLTNDWTTVNTSANWELRRSLRVLRARSRNLARNNDYVKKFLSMVRTNIAGPHGMKMQARATNAKGEFDELLNRKVEAAWKRWSHKENASASGKLSWVDIQRKLCTMLARDGEALVRAIVADNPFGFALKFISADWLDETFNERLTNGNRVIMSVEIDVNDRPVAYWLTPPPSDYQYLDNNVRARTRVPAEEIIHCYLPDDENADDDCQTRGVPWIHTAMHRLQILGAYEEAELVAARVGASKMGFYQKTTPDGEEGEYEGDDNDDGTAELMENAEAGTFGIIPQGYEFKEFKPDHPNTGYGSFTKGVLRGLSAGLDVSYFTLAEDLEGVNYSSARIGLMSEREQWRALQQFLIEHFSRSVYLMWLKSAMLAGALDIRVLDYKRLLEPVFQPRGWAWVDPKTDALATVTGIDNGFDTITDTLAEQGKDIEEVLATRKRELKLLKDYGIELHPEKPRPDAPSDEEEAPPPKSPKS
ncbi:MAG TPA: phage portal protein [Pyrinomonadaceae bacterium]|jgi:lambda family phage portal protein